ncbi:MAG: T9SS type A sorting domain-containing protein [Aureispira sp.]|nr:T9SS type A sorting domain-containing protein [Aureispira sp.]
MRTSRISFSLCIAFLFLCSINGFGQGWEKVYPLNIFPSSNPAPFHGFNSFTSASNGDYIAAGSNLILSTKPKNISLQRIDPNGNLIWQKSFFPKVDSTAPLGDAWVTKKIIATTDSNYLVLINKYSYISSTPYSTIEVLKVNEQGDSLWHNSYNDHTIAKDLASNIIETMDGNYLIAGNHDDIYNGDTTQRQRAAKVIKIDGQGQVIWKSIYTIQPSIVQDTAEVYPLTTGIDLLELASGKLLLIGKHQTVNPLGLPFADTAVIFHINSTGTKLQEQIYSGHSFANILPTTNQHFWLTDQHNSHLYLSKLDTTGSIVWSSSALDTLSNIGNLQDLSWSHDNKLLGLHNYVPLSLPVFQKTSIIKLDTTGTIIWEKRDTNSEYQLYEVVHTSDKGAIATGLRYQNGGGSSPSRINPFMIKLDSTGESHTNLIRGYVAKDANINCLVDSTELELKNWVIKMTSDGLTYYTTSNNKGYYEFLTSIGNYSLEIVPPSSHWMACTALHNGTFINPKDTVSIDFAVQAEFDCPLLHVDISTPLLRRCFWNRYTVSYCNNGTEMAYSPYVEVTLDPYLTVDSTSIPYTSQTGNTYTFPINNLDINECGQFYIYTQVDCDSTVVGQTHCTEAHIFPDTTCLDVADWDGSDIQVTASCDSDSIYFTISNIGSGPMATARNYWIAEDHIMMLMGTYNLGAGQSTQIAIPATGKTYRLEAEQAPNHPLRTIAAANIERCGSNPAGIQYSLGIIPQYSPDDESPFIAIDCQQNVGSWDPNDKQAFPKGYGEQHYIYQNQSLDYKIRFQNTGTDTAFNIVVLDTISPFLDISSIQVGASSHPYTWELMGQNIVKFTFSNIMLPDSNINEPASHGFIKFQIDQIYNNTLGTVIENQAAIYFDFNAPVLTNTTMHTIGEDFITLSIRNPETPSSSIQAKIYPNPMQTQATVVIDSENIENIQFKLYNTMGQLVYEKQSAVSTFQIEAKNLPQGIYLYTLEVDDQRIQSGRIIIQ